jgi:hypothetical protein
MDTFMSFSILIADARPSIPNRKKESTFLVQAQLVEKNTNQT